MRELVFECRQEQAEPWSEALLDAGALSVSVADADDGTAHEQPLYGEPGSEPDTRAWSRNSVVALLADEADAGALIASACGLLGQAEAPPWTLREVADADWVRLTQAQFDPIAVDERIWIVPSWHELPPAASAAEAIAIHLDPGLAFGTGSHPTTHLCLAWLAAHIEPGMDVLDYGCGSGILAIAAHKLGAARVLGVDIDPQAVQSTRDNAAVNDAKVEALLPDALSDGEFSVVVANILSNPLKVLAPMLSGRVAAGGRLVLSGVLERQAEEVCAAYAPWLEMSVWRAQEGWVCLHGRKAG